MKLFRWLFLVMVFAIPKAQAQYQDIRFKHLSVEDGISQSTIHCILEDKYGYIWFGTQDGLNKYDGYAFTVYRHNPKDASSLRTSSIQVLYEDRKGNLWIGTNSGGLSLYDRNADSFVHFGKIHPD